MNFNWPNTVIFLMRSRPGQALKDQQSKLVMKVQEQWFSTFNGLFLQFVTNFLKRDSVFGFNLIFIEKSSIFFEKLYEQTFCFVCSQIFVQNSDSRFLIGFSKTHWEKSPGIKKLEFVFFFSNINFYSF
jgi:hypothetical protein